MATDRSRATPKWRFVDNELVPTREHLSATCEAVATIGFRDKIIKFQCTTPSEEDDSYLVPIHFSRIHIHQGPLLELLHRHGASPTNPRVIIPVDQPSHIFQCIAKYLYCANVDLSSFAFPDLAGLAAMAYKWKCFAIFEASLILTVRQDLLRAPTPFPSHVRLRWLRDASPSFREYFCLKFGNVSKFLQFPQIVDVLHFANETGNKKLHGQVLALLVESDLMETKHHLQLLLFVFKTKRIPPVLREYIISHSGQFCNDWYPVIEEQKTESPKPDYDLSTKANEGADQKEEPPTETDSPERDFVSEAEVWRIFHREQIAIDVFRSMLSQSDPSQSEALLFIALKYIEPLLEEDTEMTEILQELSGSIQDPYKLITNQSLDKHLSVRALRLCAAALFQPRTENLELQLSMLVSWKSIRMCAGHSRRGSLEGLKCTLVFNEFSGWGVLIYLDLLPNVSLEKWPHSSLTLTSTATRRKCKCPLNTSPIEKKIQKTLWSRGVKGDDEDGIPLESRQEYILDQEEVEEWSRKHTEDCKLFVRVKLEAHVQVEANNRPKRLTLVD